MKETTNHLASRLIRIEDSGSSALVYPERGFQLQAFDVALGGNGGRRVAALYGQEGLHEPPDRRYGNPVLFPAVGISHGSQPDSWDHAGRALPMPPHGWARNVYWQVEHIDARSVTAVLIPHNGFRLGFPFDFELRMTYEIAGRALTLTTIVENKGTAAFPYALGFHPYLRTPVGGAGAKAKCHIDLPGGQRVTTTDGWRTHSRAPMAARTISAADADLPNSYVLADTGARAIEIVDEAAQLATRVSVEGSDESFPTWVVWSAAPDAPYVCIEPWTDVPNALNRAGTRTLAPGAAARYRMAIEVHHVAK